MHNLLLEKQLQWWFKHEPDLLDKLQQTLQPQFSVLPELSLLLGECLKFLYLAGNVAPSDVGRVKYTPSLIVDETWHCLILFTRSYHQFCHLFYGAYIHHHPGGDEATNHTQLQFTLYALQSQFGKLDSNIWPVHEVLDISGHCSTCET